MAGPGHARTCLAFNILKATLLAAIQLSSPRSDFFTPAAPVTVTVTVTDTVRMLIAVH